MDGWNQDFNKKYSKCHMLNFLLSKCHHVNSWNLDHVDFSSLYNI
jgi:hypothetical protein